MIGLGLGLGLDSGGVLTLPPPAVAPSGVFGSDLGGGQVELAWTDAPDAPNGYDWQLWLDGAFMQASGIVSFGISPQNVTSVPSGTYYFRMRTRAYTSFSASAWFDSSLFGIA